MKLMKLYHHHVGLVGSDDFGKTVFKAIPNSFIRLHAEKEVREELGDAVDKLFPSGYFNCWGVPSGADKVIGKLSEDDCVLLIKALNAPDGIPALCQVKLFWRVQLPALSKSLWGDDKFPYIFFFETEPLIFDWITFLEEMGYKPNLNPRGQFSSVSDGSLKKWGGAAEYVSHLRRSYAKEANLFSDVSPIDVATEASFQYTNMGSSQVNKEISAIREEFMTYPGSPPLIQEAGFVSVQALSRSSAFSVLVRRAYGFRCAMCGAGAKGPNGESEVDGAHIYPKRMKGSDDIRNGLCLCKKHHWAFDVGWISLSENYTLTVNPETPKDPDYSFIHMCHGKKLNLPINPDYWPHSVFIEAHLKMQQDLAASETSSEKITPATNIALPV